MRIGVAKEIKPDEYRVALTPAGARELVAARSRGRRRDRRRSGQRVPRQRLRGRRRPDRGRRRRLGDRRHGPEGQGAARRRSTVGSAKGLILFTYLHLAADEQLTRALVESGATCIAYETVETDDRRLPLLAPMSEVAGRLATQMGAWALEKAQGGRGLLLGGVPGVPPAKVVVLGGGIVGYNAALIAVGMQADVWVLDKSVERMRDLEMMLDGRITLAMSNRLQIELTVADADLIIGAVLIPGARAPKLITREMLGGLKPGAVLVDVAIDQGGCFETSRPTTHSDPIFVVDGIVHYCVANMPGAVPITSTMALTNVTLPYVEAIADHGVREAVARDRALARGVNVVDGKLTYEAVADAHGLEYSPLEQVLPLEPVA